MTGQSSCQPVRCSIIVPVRDGAETLSDCLGALLNAVGQCDEIIVVDDHSQDDSARTARDRGVRVIDMPAGRTGAGAARNVGAQAAQGTIVLFVDADVVVEPETVETLLTALEDGVDAVVGAYAPCEPDLGLCARVKDASIRLNHARAGRDIAWFWTGLGAMRAEVFRAAGGFDEAHFSGASVEDMDLGYRVTASGGRIRQVPEARVRHRHKMGFIDLLGNDLRKSRDWTRTLIRHGTELSSGHGTTEPAEVARVVVASVGVAGLLSPVTWPLSAAAGAGLALLMRRDLQAVAAERGAREAAGYLLVRMGAYPAAAIGSAWGTAGALLERRL